MSNFIKKKTYSQKLLRNKTCIKKLNDVLNSWSAGYSWAFYIYVYIYKSTGPGSFSNVVWEIQLIINHNAKVFDFLKELWLMCLTGWWNCDEVMGLMEPQAVLSWQGWVEGDGPSCSKKCLLDKLRCEQLSSDHQDGKRRGVECLQLSSDMKSYVSEWQNPVMPCRQRR